jgi:hypothetical protein
MNNEKNNSSQRATAAAFWAGVVGALIAAAGVAALAWLGGVEPVRSARLAFTVAFTVLALPFGFIGGFTLFVLLAPRK